MTLKDDLISYYKLDETSGTTAEDSHGSNDGTANDARVFTTEATGIINTGADFTQGDDWIDLTGISSTSGTYTFSFWADIKDNASYFFDIESGRLVLSFGSHSDGEIGFYDGTWKKFGVTPSSGLKHYVIILDSSESKGFLYIDNVLQTTQPAYSSKDIGGKVALGSRNDGNAEYIDATIDEVGIWSRALTSDEVSDLYNDGNGLSYDFDPDIIINPSALTLSTSDKEPTYFIDVSAVALEPGLTLLSPDTRIDRIFRSSALTLDLELKEDSQIQIIIPPEQKGQKGIKTEYPLDSLDRQQVNLTPTGVLGIKSLVLKKNRVGLEHSE